MELSQERLGVLFLLSLAAGILMGILWSAVRIWRGLCGATERSHGRRIFRILRGVLLIGVDIMVCLLCSVILILVLYYGNDGQFRLLAVVGSGLGLAVWRRTLGRPLGRLTDRIAIFLRRKMRILLVWLSHRVMTAGRALVQYGRKISGKAV